jgi:4-hydroxy-tetrahydrodipicolinate synthase
MVAPYYNKPTQQGFYEHYKAVAEAVGIPLCVYNIPGRTGKNIEPETIARMAELENIALVKEATGSLDQASQILCTTDLTLLSGDDSLTLPLMAVGGEGVISVVGNIVPADMIAMVEAFRGETSKGVRSTASCSRSAATCWAWPRTRFPSRRRCSCSAATRASCVCR